MRARLSRLFWIGAAVLLGAAALVAVTAVVRGDFTDTDGKILAVLGTALVAGGVALGGLALIERRELVPLAWAAVLGALVLFAILVVETVREWDVGDLSMSCYLVLAVLLLAVTAGLLRRPPGDWTFWPTLALLAIGTIVSEVAIFGDVDSETWTKPLAVLWILAGLGWFLVPVLGRLAGRPEPRPAERVVGRGPGRVEVDLAPGEVLVVRHG